MNRNRKKIQIRPIAITLSTKIFCIQFLVNCINQVQIIWFVVKFLVYRLVYFISHLFNGKGMGLCQAHASIKGKAVIRHFRKGLDDQLNEWLYFTNEDQFASRYLINITTLSLVCFPQGGASCESQRDAYEFACPQACWQRRARHILQASSNNDSNFFREGQPGIFAISANQESITREADMPN